jgi:hypothetical protein
MTSLRLVIIALLLAGLIGLLAFAVVDPTAAQTETPTPTPFPATYTTTGLSNGSALLIERRVTFGDLFVGFAALTTAVALVATTLPGIGERLFKR